MGLVQAYLVHPDAPQEAMPASGASQLQRRWGAPPRFTQSAETTPATPPSYDKDEVNYRYAADPAQACGKCRHFDADAGSCELVEGLIRTIDTCDKFEAGRMAPSAQAGPADWSGLTSPGMDSSYDDWYAGGALDLGMNGPGGGASQCAPEDQDSAGRCPDDPNFDEFTVGMWGGGNYDDGGGYGYDAYDSYESKAGGPVQAELVGAG